MSSIGHKAGPPYPERIEVVIEIPKDSRNKYEVDDDTGAGIGRDAQSPGPDGVLAQGTYLEGDGVPYGEYTLEFKWFEQRLSGERDRFGGRYSNPASPFKKIKVEKGADLELGNIELSLSKPGD